MSKTNIDQNLIVISSDYMNNNSFIIFNKNEAIVIDPSFNGKEILSTIPKDCSIVAILLTHAHFDHCFSVATILEKFNCSVYIHELEKDTYYRYRYDELANLKVIDFSNNIKWFSSNKIKFTNFIFDVIHTPGHTTGSVIYKMNDWIFTGDTLFYNSYGRTDLGNSNSNDIVKSLNVIWKQAKDNDLILPGHGKWAKFKEIKKINFMVNGLIKK